MVALNILIVDDSPDDVFFMRAAFKRAGLPHRLHAGANGLEAISFLRGEEAFADRTRFPFPDVVLLDLNMPRMNGFEVLEWIRRDADWRRLIVHVVTGSPRPDDIERAYTLGANSYVLKPSRPDELVAFVAAFHQWHQRVCLAQIRPGPR